jgi:DNA-binding transcriptional LysR family regulator
MLGEAEQAETAIRHRLVEPSGTVRCTAAVATMQFAMRDIVPDFLIRYPKVDVVAHATDQNVDIVAENYDVAVRAHTAPLPDSTLVQRALTPAPWFLFAGSTYLDADEAPQSPKDLQNHPSLFMMRTGVAPVWRLRHSSKAKDEVVIRLTPETGGDRRPRNRRPARLRLPRRRSIGSIAARVAHLACRRFHDHCSHSL